MQKKYQKKSQQQCQQLQLLPQQSQQYTNKFNINLNELKYKYENSLKEVNDYYTLLEETEKQHLRLAIIEQRDHFCTFFRFMKPVLVS